MWKRFMSIFMTKKTLNIENLEIFLPQPSASLEGCTFLFARKPMN